MRCANGARGWPGHPEALRPPHIRRAAAVRAMPRCCMGMPIDKRLKEKKQDLARRMCFAMSKQHHMCWTSFSICSLMSLRAVQPRPSCEGWSRHSDHSQRGAVLSKSDTFLDVSLIYQFPHLRCSNGAQGWPGHPEALCPPHIRRAAAVRAMPRRWTRPSISDSRRKSGEIGQGECASPCPNSTTCAGYPPPSVS